MAVTKRAALDWQFLACVGFAIAHAFADMAHDDGLKCRHDGQ